MVDRLSGRRIVITGAGSGIGRETAILFAAEGATTALLDIDLPGLEITSAKSGGMAVLADVTDESLVAAAIQASAGPLI